MSRNTWHPPARSLPGPLDHYRLVRPLGSGGMGHVWEASSDEHLDEPLAIKFLTSPLAWSNPQLFDQFKIEAKATLRVNHPNVARSHAFLDLRGHRQSGWAPAAMVMACYSVSLREVIEDLTTSGQRLPHGLASEYSRNLAEAVRELHTTHGLVHRDIKLSNILIQLREGQAYTGPASLVGSTAVLSDLGVVTHIGTVPCFRLRQDGWKGPWLFDEAGEPLEDVPASPREDLYALGLVLQRLAEVC